MMILLCIASIFLFIMSLAVFIVCLAEKYSYSWPVVGIILSISIFSIYAYGNDHAEMVIQQYTLTKVGFSLVYEYDGLQNANKIFPMNLDEDDIIEVRSFKNKWLWGQGCCASVKGKTDWYGIAR